MDKPARRWPTRPTRLAGIMLFAALLTPSQCGPPGADQGGDGNPFTGFCEYAFEETVGGVEHRYPEVLDIELRLIAGKVIFTCDRRPSRHEATAALQVRGLGAGGQWRTKDQQQSTRIPNPKDSIFLRGTCDFGHVGMWRIHLKIEGSGRDPKTGDIVSFKREDYSPERRIRCRDRR